MQEENILFMARPSLRRAYFYGSLYAVAALYGTFAVDIGVDLSIFWKSLWLILFVCMFYAYLVRITTRFLITDHQVEVTSGVFARRLAVVPYKRITNVAAAQSFGERLLGLTNIFIDSAGSDRQEVKFWRLTMKEARVAGELIREILEKNAGGEVKKERDRLNISK